MKIQWFGNSTFLLTTNLGKKILLDPFNIFSTLNENITANISTFSRPIDFSSAKNIKIFGKIVNTACNSAIENIKVEGYECKSDSINGLKRGPNIIYLFKVDNLKICHLCYLGEFINNELIKILSNADILFIPIGGNLCLNGIDAYSLSEKLNAKYIIPIRSEKMGYIKSMDNEKIGYISSSLGAGRLKKEDKINDKVGIIINKKIGDKVNVGDVLGFIHSDDVEVGNNAVKEMQNCYEFSDEYVEKQKHILGIIK